MTVQPGGQDNKLSWHVMEIIGKMPSLPIQFLNVSASVQLVTGRYLVRGVSLENSGGAGGTLILCDGRDSTGTIIGLQGYGATSSQSQVFGPVGVLAQSGIYLNVNGGTLTGTVWVVPLWQYDITPPGT